MLSYFTRVWAVHLATLPFEVRRSKSLVSISNIAGTIEEAKDYKTDAVTAANREPGVAIALVETA